jgi:uncharacterized SAM-binding protein YcdF (DUF218 family)
MIVEILRGAGRLLEPSILLPILVLAGGVAAMLRRWALVRLLVGTAAALVIFFGMLPGATWLALPLEGRFPVHPPLPATVDGIIALGGTERLSQSTAWKQPIVDDAMPIVALTALSRRYPDAKLVFSGGLRLRRPEAPSEAAIVQDFLRALAIDDSRIIYEDRSRNTYENAVFTRDIVHPRSSERWILVTQGISMPRAIGAFRRAGWNVIPYPAGFLTGDDASFAASFDLGNGLRLASLAVHEWGGLAVYWLAGYTDQLFPR